MSAATAHASGTPGSGAPDRSPGASGRTPGPAAGAGRRAPGTLAAWTVMAALAGLGLWSTIALGIEPATITGSLGNAVDFLARMFPLDFPPAGELVAMIGETLAIVVLATLLAMALSVPVALAAAQATTRGRISRSTARTLIVLARAIPDLVLAIVFLRMFGLGPVAGILAMGIHSVGMIGKLCADAIEELDDAPRQAVEAIGGSRRQQIWAVIPQALLPQVVATGLHRFDINLRTSVLLGYVGVGGIGLEIADALRSLDYQRGIALALVVLVLCIVLELVSGSIRAALAARTSRTGAARGWAERLWRRGRPASASGPQRPVGIDPPWTADRVRRILAIAVLALIAAASVHRIELSPATLVDGIAALPRTAMLFLPPSFGGSALPVLEDLLVTVQIALAATFLGAILALPIGVLAARTVVPSRAVHTAFRVLIVVIRGIPELILAIVFVVVSGLGAVAGTLALALGAVGLLSKLVADSIEETVPTPQDALRTVGASGPQVFFAATLRQAAPAVVAHTLYLLDTNIRSATLLGVVGAGGVGFLLLNAARVNQFEVVTAIVLLLTAVVLAVEALAMWLRRAVR